jgi:hypothetical protein
MTYDWFKNKQTQSVQEVIIRLYSILLLSECEKKRILPYDVIFRVQPIRTGDRDRCAGIQPSSVVRVLFIDFITPRNRARQPGTSKRVRVRKGISTSIHTNEKLRLVEDPDFLISVAIRRVLLALVLEKVN